MLKWGKPRRAMPSATVWAEQLEKAQGLRQGRPRELRKLVFQSVGSI